MIDFRYHLVSIAGIFLALAVGIVLGAGPLKGEISSTITNEVASLRADKSQLNDEVADLKSGTEARDKLLTQTSPTVLSGTLAGRSVAMVALPGVDANFMAATRATLVASGAEVASSVSVTDKWPASATSGPTAAVTEIAGILGVERAGDGVLADQVLGALLARADATETTALTLEQVRAGLDALREAGLIDTDTTQVAQAEAIVVLAATVTSGTPEEAALKVEPTVRLAGALDSVSGGVVLASNLPTTDVDAERESVLTLREDRRLAQGVSTIDDATEPMGQLSIAFGLVQQLAGGVGHYGFGAGASAPFAPLASS